MTSIKDVAFAKFILFIFRNSAVGTETYIYRSIIQGSNVYMVLVIEKETLYLYTIFDISKHFEFCK